MRGANSGGVAVEVVVNGSLNRALTVLKRKLRAEGVFAIVERHAKYLKPGDRRRLKHQLFLGRRTRSERRQQAATCRWMGES
jgi:ribosomal protein S21